MDNNGCEIEGFFGIVQVNETKVVSHKAMTKALFSKPGLSIMILRGQGYDGACNMHGKFYNLKTLIMKETNLYFMLIDFLINFNWHLSRLQKITP